MRTILLLSGSIPIALILFIVGLMPGERLLSSSGEDSPVLVGVSRFAVYVIGWFEFVLGGVLVAVWVWRLRRTKTTAK